MSPQSPRFNPADKSNDGWLGEVIEASTTRFVAQCPPVRLHDPPAFGAFVKILPSGARSEAAKAPPPVRIDDPFADPEPSSSSLAFDAPDETLYAIVFEARTGSAEPGRRASAYGLGEDELRAEQPQIFDLLATEFDALHVGFARDGRFRPYLPARPPRLHAMVEACAPEEVCVLTESPDIIRWLLNAPIEVSADELLAACLRHAYLCRNRDFPFLVRMGKQAALLLREDPERLAALLRRLEP